MPSASLPAVLLLVEASAADTMFGALSNFTVAPETVFSALAPSANTFVPAPAEMVVTRSSFFAEAGGVSGTQSGTLDDAMFAVIVEPKSSKRVLERVVGDGDAERRTLRHRDPLQRHSSGLASIRMECTMALATGVHVM